MTVAVALLLYAACVGTLGSRLLGRAKWTARVLQLAIVTYLAAIGHLRAAGRQALRHVETAPLAALALGRVRAG